MKQGFQTIHLAAQYLAAAGISFIPERADDSHTNLGFSKETKSFETWPLNECGSRLTLDLGKFELNWASVKESRSLSLHGCSHTQVLEWIYLSCTALKLGKPYNYNFLYELPYPISDKYIFQKDQEVLDKEIRLRSLAHNVFVQFLRKHQLSSDIRTWPHHFDTGVFANLPAKPDISVSAGLAIPDSLVSDYYFYVSAYEGQDSLDTSAFTNLDHGKWLQNGFQGAVLAASEIDEKVALNFLDAALDAYL